MGKDKANLRRTVKLANKELNEIFEAVELVGGIHLDMSLSFSMGILRRTMNGAKEEFDAITKENFRAYAVIKKDAKTGEDKQFIPVRKLEEFEKAQKTLDIKEMEYDIPTLALADFTADDENDEDDPKNKIPSGFVGRIMPILTDWETYEKDNEVKK